MLIIRSSAYILPNVVKKQFSVLQESSAHKKGRCVLSYIMPSSITQFYKVKNI